MNKQNLLLISNSVLAVAVIVLFVLYFCGGAKKTQREVGSADSLTNEQKLLPIAYVDVDSLLLNYNFSKGANENLLAKTEKNENYLRREMEKFQKSVLEYQQKAQTGAFLSRESEMKQGEQLKRKQQELENMQERMTKELLTEQNKLNEQLKDSINAFMEEYNKTRNYEIIFSNAMNNNVLYAKKGYNITAEVIELLNARYPAAE